MADDEAPKQKVLLYMREMTGSRAPYAVKFAQFYKAVGRAQSEHAAIIVAAPQVLGDTYDELITSLNVLAGTNVPLRIAGAIEEGDVLLFDQKLDPQV